MERQGGATTFEAGRPTAIQPRQKIMDLSSAKGWARFILQERKISPKRKFVGRTSRRHPGVIRADIPAQNFGQGGQNPGKQAFWRGHP